MKKRGAVKKCKTRFPHLEVYFSSSVTNCSSIFHICMVKVNRTFYFSHLCIQSIIADQHLTMPIRNTNFIHVCNIRNYDSWMTSTISWSVIHCCIVILTRIKNYGFIVCFKFWWLNKQKKLHQKPEMIPRLRLHGNNSSDKGNKK